MPPKVSALPPEAIGDKLDQTGIMAQDIRAMLRPEAWAGLQSRNEHVVFLHNFAETGCDKSLSNQVLGYVFEIQESHVRKIRSKAKRKARAPHRPLALTYEEENAVIEFIEAGDSKATVLRRGACLILWKPTSENV
jgi:hypothetical protein